MQTLPLGTIRTDSKEPAMLIDCATCLAPEHACRDCVVTLLLGTTGSADSTDSADSTAATVQPTGDHGARPHLAAVELDDAEQRALAQLSAAGLVPPLRLVKGGEAGGKGGAAAGGGGGAAGADGSAPAGKSPGTRKRNRNIA